MSNSTDNASLSGYRVLVCVCGGIAAYKVASVVSALVQRDVHVTVAMTEAAQRFITPLTFESLTARSVMTSVWQGSEEHDPQHLSLTENADLIVVAPATANIIGKFAAGLADDVVSTLVLAKNSPVLLVPAMNTRMWENPIVQRNLETLGEMGFDSMSPGEGWLACRTIGKGRMPEPAEIVSRASEMLLSWPAKSSRSGNGDS